jgi:O-antigen ligase
MPFAFSIWGIIALSWVGLSLWRNRGTLAQHLGAVGILLFLLLSSLTFSMNRTQSLYYTIQAIVFILLALWLKTEFKVQKHENDLWKTLVVSGLLTAGITVFQRLTHHEPIGLLPINPDFNAAWMASLAAAFTARLLQNKTLPFLDRRASWIVVSLLSGLVIIGLPRSPLLGLIVGIGYAIWKTPRNTLVFRIFMGLLFVTLLCFPETVFSRFRTSTDLLHADHRPEIWAVALKGAADRPWTGYGLGNFEIAYQKHSFPVSDEAVRYARTTVFAHNEFLQTAVDLGIPALIALLFGLYSLFRMRNRDVPERFIPSRAALLVIAVVALFNPVWHHPFLLYMTLLWAGYGRRLEKDVPLPAPTPAAIVRIQYYGWGVLFSAAFIYLCWTGVRSHWAAEGRWDPIVRWNTADGEAWKNLALNQDRPADSIPNFQKALKHMPYDIYTREDYAIALEQQATRDSEVEALHQYAAALDLAPHRAVDALAIGRILFKRNQAAQAREWFKYARRLEPHYWESELWVARCSYQMGDKQSAARMVRNLIRRHNAFLKRQKEWVINNTLYENVILSYDRAVVEKDLRRFLS